MAKESIRFKDIYHKEINKKKRTKMLYAGLITTSLFFSAPSIAGAQPQLQIKEEEETKEVEEKRKTEEIIKIISLEFCWRPWRLLCIKMSSGLGL